MFAQKPLRTLSIALLLSSILISGCMNESQSEAANAQQQAPQKTPVDVVELRGQTVDLKTELPARTTATRMAQVRPQVNGIIEQRLFTEGETVKAGQQLYQIEAAPYQATVQTAQANLKRAQADLKVTESRESRYKSLLDDNAISQQEYDEALAAFEQARAEIAVSQAALDTALIELRYTKVNAPLEGQIGISHVTEGALVTAGQTDSLATIHQLDPIYVDISQASKEILRLRRQFMTGRMAGEKVTKVQLKLEDGSDYEHTGALQFSEVNVNQSTGSIVMRARFPNPDGLLLPGMYVRAEVDEGQLDNAILVPQKAVAFDREGNASVMLVNAENKVEQRQISILRNIGQNWLLDDGLTAGDKVIVEGLQKIAEGSEVEIDQESSSNQVEG